MTQPLPILALVGPTAVGKTALAMTLSHELPCDLISVDSALVYRGLDIGTAKPSPALLAEFPHALIDIRDPAEPYSAADFCRDAKLAIAASHQRGRIPLLVGGTMLYFKALFSGLATLPTADPVLRAQLTQEAQQSGWPHMHEKLRMVDPTAAARIHPNDPSRIQRALEVFLTTGKNLTTHFLEQSQQTALQLNLMVALVPNDRAMLHKRIAERFDAMLTAGFLEEVARLKARADLNPDLPALRAVGYRQAWAHLAGEISYAEMHAQAVAATRQLAKRQLTWIRNWPIINCIDSDQPNLSRKVLTQMQQACYTRR